MAGHSFQPRLASFQGHAINELARGIGIGRTKRTLRLTNRIPHSMKIEIDQKTLDGLKAWLTPDQASKVQELIEVYHEMVVAIEASPMITQYHYGSYMPYVKNRQDMAFFRLAGAPIEAMRSVAMVNGIA